MTKKLSALLVGATLALSLTAGSAQAAATYSLGAGASYSLTNNFQAGNIVITEDMIPTGSGTVSGLLPTTTYTGIPNVASITLNTAEMVSGSVADDAGNIFSHIQPSNLVDTRYMSIYGRQDEVEMPTNNLPQHTTGSVTLDFTGFNYNEFSMNWGSVDGFNQITIYTTDGSSYVIDGAAVHSALLTGLGDGTTAGTDATMGALSGNGYYLNTYLDIITASAISKIVLTSADTSFEFGDMKVSSVPLPAALPLFGSALMGLAGFRRKRNAA